MKKIAVEVEADLILTLETDLAAGTRLVIVGEEIVMILPPARAEAPTPPPEPCPQLQLPPLPYSYHPETPLNLCPAAFLGLPAATPEAPFPGNGHYLHSDGEIGRMEEGIIRLLKERGPMSARMINRELGGYDTHDAHRALKEALRYLRTYGDIVPMTDSRFPQYALTGAPTSSRRRFARPDGPALITAQSVKKALATADAMSLADIAGVLDIESQTHRWTSLSKMVARLVRNGDVERAEVDGVAIFAMK